MTDTTYLAALQSFRGRHFAVVQMSCSEQVTNRDLEKTPTPTTNHGKVKSPQGSAAERRRVTFSGEC
jgi:hypothetical protein